VASLLRSSRGIWRAGGSYGKLFFHMFILLFELLALVSFAGIYSVFIGFLQKQ